MYYAQLRGAASIPPKAPKRGKKLTKKQIEAEKVAVAEAAAIAAASMPVEKGPSLFDKMSRIIPSQIVFAALGLTAAYFVYTGVSRARSGGGKTQ